MSAGNWNRPHRIILPLASDWETYTRVKKTLRAQIGPGKVEGESFRWVVSVNRQKNRISITFRDELDYTQALLIF